MTGQQIAELDYCLCMLRSIIAKHPRGFRGTMEGYKGYNCTEPKRFPTPLELIRDAEHCHRMASALLTAAESTSDE